PSPAGITLSPTSGLPPRRRQWTRLEESTSFVTAYSPRRSFISSAWVMNVFDDPKRLVRAAMRFRRLKSFRAVTTASRLVVAPVNRMASLSSLSGISTVVFMASNLARDGIQTQRCGNPEGARHGGLALHRPPRAPVEHPRD